MRSGRWWTTQSRCVWSPTPSTWWDITPKTPPSSERIAWGEKILKYYWNLYFKIQVYECHSTLVQNIYRPQTKLGQSNVFTPACHSVHRGWGGFCIQGVGQIPPPRALRDMVNKRSVRMLLECILVVQMVILIYWFFFLQNVLEKSSSAVSS